MSQSYINRVVYPLSERFAIEIGLPHLGPHLPTLILSFLIWNTVQYILSPYLSSYLSNTYAEHARHAAKTKHGKANKLSKNEARQKGIKSLDTWHAHSVAFLHAVVILPLAVACLDFPALDGPRARALGWDDRVGTVHAITCGYFLWDLFDSILNYESIGFVLHAVACLTVFLLGYRPFLAYYGPRFLLWELSTPLLNLNWFFERTRYKGSRLHLLNGISLLVSFFFARLVYGTYMSYNFYKTCWLNRDEIPAGLLYTYAIGNLLLNGLNFFWFSKMLKTVKRRFAGGASNANGATVSANASNQASSRVAQPASSPKGIEKRNPRMRIIA